MMTENGNNSGFQRLPTFSKPTHYTLHLKPDLDTFTFTGEAAIDIEILEPTDYLKLYFHEIEVSKANIKLEDNTNLPNLPVSYNAKRETMDIKLPKQLAKGKCTLTREYKGILNDTMHGFYRSKYTDSEGNEKYMVSTQFESTYARYAFPCYDEPIYKATYDITLTVKDKYTALSNMNVISEKKLEDGWKTVTYGKTPKMSSYLVAFAVGEFGYVEDKTSDGVIVRVYSVPEKVDQLNFSLGVACKALDYFNDFFGSKYSLPKCDLIAIPDFSMGAMENWGLITYREAVLLMDPTKSSQRMKTRIAQCVSHELAHMWFGNLVTMKWWTDLWLKEGFARYMEYTHVGHAFPELDIWLRFASDQMDTALGLDSLRSSHAIEIAIENPNELEEFYDSITYAKSSCIIGMLYNYLGHEVFKSGCQQYLKKFQYSNAQTTDLWDSLSQASGENVEQLMSDWTQQMGFPVISVHSRQDGDKRVINLSQKRFMADGSDDPAEQLWRIPISICTSDDPTEKKFKILMDKRQQGFTLDGVPQDKWIKLNVGMTGFYRIEYSTEMLNSLLTPLKKLELPTIDRFNILSDIFALVRAGRVDVGQFLEVIKACRDESQFLVWDVIDSGIGTISNVLTRTDMGERFNKFIQDIYAPIAEKLGWEPKDGEGSHTQLLRPLLLSRLGKSGHENTIEKVRELFKNHVENGIDLNPDLRGMIYFLIGRHNGQEGFESLKKILESNTSFVEVQRNCLPALGASPDQNIQLAAFDYMMTSGKIRPQDYPWAFVGVCASRQGQDTALKFFKQRFTDLIGVYGGANSILFQSCLKITGHSHCTEEVACDMETFLSASEHANTMDRSTKQTCEAIRLNASLLKRNKDLINTWLTANGY